MNRVLIGILIGTFLVASTAGAQQRFPQNRGFPENVVTWSVEVRDEYSAHDTGKYRLYSTPDELTLFITIWSERGEAFVLNSGDVPREMRWRASHNGRELDVISNWHPEASTGFPERVRVPLSSADAIRVERPHGVQPNAGVRWTVALRKADGEAFEQGHYEIDISIERAIARFKKADGRPWGGIASQNTRKVRLDVRTPSAEPAEQAAAFRQQGRWAKSAGRHEDAVRAYELALRADPTSRGALVDVGEAYLDVGRFADAIPVLEKAMATGTLHHSTIPTLLAVAYLGANDEASARRVLEKDGVTDVPNRIKRLRAGLSRRQK